MYRIQYWFRHAHSTPFAFVAILSPQTPFTTLCFSSSYGVPLGQTRPPVLGYNPLGPRINYKPF